MHRKATKTALVLCAILVLSVLPNFAFAQLPPFVLSKLPDFSTLDRAFARTDTIYVRVFRPEVDFTRIVEMRFRLQARGGDQHIDGHFVNNFDGSYTASLALGQLDASILEWDLKVEIKDNQDNRLSLQVTIVIGGGDGVPELLEGRIAIEGRLTGLGADSLQVSGLWFAVDDSTKYFGGDRNEIGFDDLAIGAPVNVLAFPREGQLPLARYVKADLGAADEPLEVEGFVSAVDSARLVVKGIPFFVDKETDLRRGDGTEIPLDSVRVRMFARVLGRFRDDGHLWAQRIRVLRGGPEERLEIKGPVEAVTDTSVTVDGIEFVFSENLELHGGDGIRVSREALQPGANVKVIGVLLRNGTAVALSIYIEGLRGTEIEEEGEITSLGNGVLVVNDIEFHVGDGTVVFDSERHLVRPDVLHVGMPVKVWGLELEGGRVIALRVLVRKPRHERIKRMGHIRSLTAASLTVHHTTFEVDSTTTIINAEGDMVPFEDLDVDMMVRVEGYHQDNGSVFAEHIQVRPRAGDGVEVTAPIDTVGEREIVVAGVTFCVSEHTIIVNDLRQHIELGELEIGTMVQVKGRRLADGKNFALRIRVPSEDPAGEQFVHVRGAITRVSGDTVVVEGTPVLTTTETVMLDREGNELTVGDLAEGDLVKARAVPDDNGTLVAQALRREEAAAAQGVVENSDGSPQGLSLAKTNLAADFEFLLDGTIVIVDENTLITGPFNVLLDEFDLADGALVDVQGTLTETDGLLAGSVQVLESEGVTSVGGSVQAGANVPHSFTLKQNYPNPFNPATTLSYRIEGGTAQQVLLRIYNILGQKVVTLVNEVKPAGAHSVVWSGRDHLGRQVSTGVYIVRLKVGNENQARRMLLNK